MEVLSRYYQKTSSMSVLVFGTNNKKYVEKDYYLYCRCPSGYRSWRCSFLSNRSCSFPSAIVGWSVQK